MICDPGATAAVTRNDKGRETTVEPMLGVGFQVPVTSQGALCSFVVPVADHFRSRIFPCFERYR